MWFQNSAAHFADCVDWQITHNKYLIHFTPPDFVGLTIYQLSSAPLTVFSYQLQSTGFFIVIGQSNKQCNKISSSNKLTWVNQKVASMHAHTSNMFLTTFRNLINHSYIKMYVFNVRSTQIQTNITTDDKTELGISCNSIWNNFCLTLSLSSCFILAGRHIQSLANV